MACSLYLGLSIAAPFIESFYDYDNLSFFISLQSVILIIESFSLMQIEKATRDMVYRALIVTQEKP